MEEWGDAPLPKMTYLPEGKAYEIPAACLCAEGLDGVFAAGRCLSASDEAISSARVLATAMSTGWAAGKLAAFRALGRTQDNAIEEIAQFDYLSEEALVRSQVAAAEKLFEILGISLAPCEIDGFVEYVGLEQLRLVGVDYAESRVEAEFVEVFGYQPLAERMDRTDIRRRQHNKLMPKMPLASANIFVTQTLSNSRPHLLGRHLGERKDEHIANTAAAGLIRNQIHTPPRKNRSLTSPRRSSNKHITPPRINSTLLLLSPFYFILSSFSLVYA